MRAEQRSRRGCKQCRSGHHKCDETPPTCKRCQSRGFKCEYPVTRIRWGNVTTVELASRNRTTALHSSPRNDSPESARSACIQQGNSPNDDDLFDDVNQDSISVDSTPLPLDNVFLQQMSSPLFETQEEIAAYTYCRFHPFGLSWGY